MTDLKKLEEARLDRGNQLRALIISWNENTTFVEALAKQQKEIDAGEFTPSPDWGMIADEILAQYLSQPRMTDWDDKPEEPEPPKPKIIMP